MRETIIQKVLEEKAVAIVRGASVDACLKVADALYAGGVRLMEITFNHKNPDSYKDTAEAIKQVAEKYEGKMYIGAGTVISPELVELARESGMVLLKTDERMYIACGKLYENGLKGGSVESHE